MSDPADSQGMCNGQDFGVMMTIILVCTSSGRRGRLIGSLGSILEVLGRGTGPKREEMAGRSLGVDSQDLATILDPFGAIFVHLGPDRLSATLTIETSET